MGIQAVGKIIGKAKWGVRGIWELSELNIHFPTNLKLLKTLISQLIICMKGNSERLEGLR
jgi:hypothetical protein